MHKYYYFYVFLTGLFSENYSRLGWVCSSPKKNPWIVGVISSTGWMPFLSSNQQHKALKEECKG